MVYDFYYNQNKTLCYDVKPVNIKDVESVSSIKRILNNSKFITTLILINNNWLDDIIMEQLLK
jgi:hypothetical protein